MNHVLMLACNNRHLTQRAIESVLKQDIPVCLCVLNDASTDDTAAYLNSLPEIYAVHMPSSLGVSKLWNLGLATAFDEDVEHVLVLNNDLELPPHYYRLLLEINEGFISGVSVNQREMMQHYSSTLRPHPDFSAFLIRKEVWRRVGPFDERFVLYCGDLDYHIRMHRFHVKAWGMNLPFYHQRSSSIKLASNEERDRIQAIADEDRRQFKLKYGFEVWSPEYSRMFVQ